MRKLLSFLLISFIAVSLVACSSNSGTTEKETRQPTSHPVWAELYFKSGNKLGEVHFAYDDMGYMSSYTMKYTDEKVFIEDETHNFIYDETGNILNETVNYGSACAMPLYNYTYENGLLVKKSPGGGSYIKYVYDNKGNLTATYNVDNLGNEELFQTVECDNTGNIIRTIEMYDDRKIEWRYTYENGTIQNEEYYSNDELILSHPYIYENGLLTKQVVSIENFKNEGYLIYHYE